MLRSGVWRRWTRARGQGELHFRPNPGLVIFDRHGKTTSECFRKRQGSRYSSKSAVRVAERGGRDGRFHAKVAEGAKEEADHVVKEMICLRTALMRVLNRFPDAAKAVTDVFLEITRLGGLPEWARGG